MEMALEKKIDLKNPVKFRTGKFGDSIECTNNETCRGNYVIYLSHRAYLEYIIEYKWWKGDDLIKFNFIT